MVNRAAISNLHLANGWPNSEPEKCCSSANSDDAIYLGTAPKLLRLKPTGPRTTSSYPLPGTNALSIQLPDMRKQALSAGKASSNRTTTVANRLSMPSNRRTTLRSTDQASPRLKIHGGGVVPGGVVGRAVKVGWRRASTKKGPRQGVFGLFQSRWPALLPIVTPKATAREGLCRLPTVTWNSGRNYVHWIEWGSGPRYYRL